MEHVLDTAVIVCIVTNLMTWFYPASAQDNHQPAAKEYTLK